MNKAGIIKGEKTSENFVAGKVKDFVVFNDINRKKNWKIDTPKLNKC